MPFCKINGRLVYLWRAVDQSGEVLDVLVQRRWDGRAALRFVRKLHKGHRYVPHAIVTHKLASYACAKKAIMPRVDHHRRGRLNNRAENSHQPTRMRERNMRGFKSDKHAQRSFPVGARPSVESFPAWAPRDADVPLQNVDGEAICVLVRDHRNEANGGKRSVKTADLMRGANAKANSFVRFANWVGNLTTPSSPFLYAGDIR